MNNDLSLRDYFAGLAMQGLLQGLLASDVNHNWSEYDIAMSAYDQADAMIAERDKKAVDQTPPDYSDLLSHIKCEGCDE
jgi:hypothetical protein